LHRAGSVGFFMAVGLSDPAGITNWRRLDRRITTSGQPDEAELRAIAGLGVVAVINLGLHGHAKALPDEAASVQALGLRYIHIPVAFDRPTEADFVAFCAALGGLEDRPVHVHCIANYRVSAFFCRYRRDVLGMDAAAARADMLEIWQPDAVWDAFIGA
jgi:protein tyrosine phosphatase (PTP) superfamily phosphohydrolase (DUF442 family)